MQQEIRVSEEEDRGYDNCSRGTSHLVWIHEMHGLSQLINSKTPTAKLFWSAILGMCMMYAIINTVLVTKEYIDNRTATLMTLNQAAKLPFPTLVVCPKTADAVQLDVLLNDIHKSVDEIDNKMAVDLLAFAIAGTGFGNFERVINRMSASDEKQLSAYYKIWKGNRTAQQMLHYIFEENGYTCKQMFSGCRLGGLTLDCCDIFNQTYVLLRGRCFRMNSLHQERNDEMGKLTLFMNDLPSATYSQMKIQQQIIIYVSEKRTDVALAPQYYLSRDDWNRMRFRMKVIKMLPSSQYCSDSVHNEEKGTCFTRQWLLNKIVKPLNCTIVYLQDIFPNEPVCDPLVIIRHYRNVTDTYFGKYECLPACKRIDPTIEMTNSVFSDKSIKKHPYTLEASYSELQYDSYQEVVTITLPGFVSQIGGQMGLFLGMSIITLVQLSVWLTQTLHRRVLKRQMK